MPNKKCECCEKEDSTVRVRACGYQSDVNGIEVLETVCDACESDHIDDI